MEAALPHIPRFSAHSGREAWRNAHSSRREATAYPLVDVAMAHPHLTVGGAALPLRTPHQQSTIQQGTASRGERG